MNNITSEDILDSLMRVALTPPVTTATDHEGRTYLHAERSVMRPVVDAISERLKEDPDLREAIIEQIVEQVPTLTPEIQKRLIENVVKGGRDHYSQPVIAEWAKPAVQEALAEALRTKIEAHVADKMGDLPLSQYDLEIVVNLVPKK